MHKDLWDSDNYGFFRVLLSICYLRQHSSSVWEEREGGLCFPALLPQTLAAENPVRQRGWSKRSRVSRGKACQPRVTSTWKDSTSPLLLCLYYRTVVYAVTSVPIVPAFIAITFPCGQHNLQICCFGYSSISLGTSMPSMTVLLQRRDPRGKCCVSSYRHCWEQQCIPQPANTHACLFSRWLAEEGRAADFSTLANPM